MYNTAIFTHDGSILPIVKLDTVYELAENVDTFPAILKLIWANRGDQKVNSVALSALAENRSTPPEVLQNIWANRGEEKVNSYVLCGIARNPSTPVAILQTIWENRANEEKVNSYVLCGLACNPSTPVAILQTIWKNEVSGEKVILDVLYALARNPSTPVAILQAIWENRVNEKKVNLRTIYALAGNPSTPPAILKGIWASRRDIKPISLVPSALAKNPSTPPEVLQDIWTSRSGKRVNLDVLSALAQNQSLPYSVAFGILRDGIVFPGVLNPDSERFNPGYYHTLADACLEGLKLAAKGRICPITKEDVDKSKIIIDFVTTNCLHIRKEFSCEVKRSLLDGLKDIPKEKLPIIFRILQKMDNEESKDKLTFVNIMTKIRQLQQAKRGTWQETVSEEKNGGRSCQLM